MVELAAISPDRIGYGTGAPARPLDQNDTRSDRVKGPSRLTARDFRVFVSSPGDVAAERQVVQQPQLRRPPRT
jgi:hypothetical protein